ncbi:MAG: LysO family transporter [Desulfovibrionales bacterium]
MIVGLFAAGILLGIVFRHRLRLIRTASHASDVCVFFLLFILGVSIGRNETVIRNLASMGVAAALLTIGAVLGSLGLCYLIHRFFFAPRS